MSRRSTSICLLSDLELRKKPLTSAMLQQNDRDHPILAAVNRERPAYVALRELIVVLVLFLLGGGLHKTNFSR